MARPRSDKVRLVREKLLARLGDGLHAPGDRFMSARAISQQFGVSYQTADRLLRELVDEGRLARRLGSGTYVPGQPGRAMRGVQLIFGARARRAGSFGARLRDEMLRRFREAGVDVRTTYSVDPGADTPAPGVATTPAADRFPILWESPATAAQLSADRVRGLILNDRPPPGLGALVLDSIAVDDLLGGAIAAEMVAKRVTVGARVGVLAGPESDARSARRVEGFCSVFQKAPVIHASSWFRDDGLTPARRLLSSRPAAIFACNDRLAQAVIDAAADMGLATPVLFGFDDAPVAEQLHLSTIAIPWASLAEAAMAVALRRLSGDVTTASHLVLAPRPIVRLT